MLWFCVDLLDIMAEYVERPNAGEDERGALMEMRERVAALRAHLAGSPHEPGAAYPDGMTAPLIVFPFRYKNARTGNWVKARYMAERSEIAARYAEWEIIEPDEERRPRTGSFNPGRREGE